MNRDGNLLEGDQILAINGQRIDTGLTHQEAISILQQAQGHVELIVARGEITQPSGVSRQNSIASSSFITRTNSGASSSSMSSAPVTIIFYFTLLVFIFIIHPFISYLNHQHYICTSFYIIFIINFGY